MIEKTVICEIMKNFYDNYYLQRGRTMRKSKNIRVNAYHVEDAKDSEGNRYTLSHVVYDNVLYRIDRTLVDKLPKKIILDCEQVTA